MKARDRVAIGEIQSRAEEVLQTNGAGVILAAIADACEQVGKPELAPTIRKAGQLADEVEAERIEKQRADFHATVLRTAAPRDDENKRLAGPLGTQEER